MEQPDIDELKQLLFEREKELDGLYQLAALFSPRSADLREILNKTAEIIQASMHYPEQSQVKICVKEHQACQYVSGKPVDTYTVKRPPLEITVISFAIGGVCPRIEHRERYLIDCTADMLSDVVQRIDMEREIRERSDDLERKHIALGEIISRIEYEKQQIYRHLHTHLSSFVYPYLQKLKLSGQLCDQDNRLVLQLESSLAAMPEGNNPNLKHLNGVLSPREYEVCGLIQNGLSTKDISSLLQITPATVERHRTTIRRKLSLNRKKISLTTFLRSTT